MGRMLKKEIKNMVGKCPFMKVTGCSAKMFELYPTYNKESLKNFKQDSGIRF